MTARRWTFFGTAAVTALALTVVVKNRPALAPSEPIAAAPAAAEAGTPGGPTEGIDVHGHWTIEVRDPDGSLVARREFENAVGQTGRVMLSNWLGRTWTLGTWEVLLGNFDASQRPCNSGTQRSPCIIREIGQPEGGQAVATLTVNVVGETVVLSGNVTAQEDGVIGFVSTQPKNCLAEVSPQACALPGAATAPGGAGAALTLTTLDTPIPVQMGQSILATVTLSF